MKFSFLGKLHPTNSNFFKVSFANGKEIPNSAIILNLGFAAVC
jgi:hypothetical protein